MRVRKSISIRGFIVGFKDYLKKARGRQTSRHNLRKASVFRLPTKGFGPRNVKSPGSRGGVGYWNGKGEWVYGTIRNAPPSTASNSGTSSIINKPQVDPVSYTEKLLTKNTQPWTFISGHHKSRNPEANHQMHQNLLKEIRDRGYTPMNVTGYYTYQAEEPGAKGGVSEEPSYLIPGMATKEAIELGNTYNQQAVLTHEGMFNVETPDMYVVKNKRFIRGEIPKDQDQSVVQTPGGAKNTFLINADWDHPIPAPQGYHPHLGKSFSDNSLRKGLSRPAKYMIAAELLFLDDLEDKKKGKKNINGVRVPA